MVSSCRERAVARTRECEQHQEDAKGKVQQLEFAQLKLTQQLEAAQKTARFGTSSTLLTTDIV
jgi:hypothetical protein